MATKKEETKQVSKADVHKNVAKALAKRRSKK